MTDIAISTRIGDDPEALAAEWEALRRRDPAATPFQSPAWLVPWWRHLGGGALMLVEARRGDTLVGLAPLFVHRDGARRRLLPLGISHSDYLDILLDPSCPGPARDALFAGIAAHRHRWDVFEMHELRPGASLGAGPASGWKSAAEAQSVCPVLDLPARVEDMDRAVPRVTLRNLRQARRRAAERGTVRLWRAGADERDALFGHLCRLHAARWEERGQSGVLAGEAVRRFHLAAIDALDRAGLLRLYGLAVGGDIVGVYYGFADAGAAYAYIGGFDPGDPRQSFGTLVIGHAIENAVREGLAEFHFLRGPERYKYAWGARDRANIRRTLRCLLPAARPAAPAGRRAS